MRVRHSDPYRPLPAPTFLHPPPPPSSYLAHFPLHRWPHPEAPPAHLCSSGSTTHQPCLKVKTSPILSWALPLTVNCKCIPWPMDGFEIWFDWLCPLSRYIILTEVKHLRTPFMVSWCKTMVWNLWRKGWNLITPLDPPTHTHPLTIHKREKIKVKIRGQ